MLDNLSDRLAGRAERPVAEVQATFTEFERAIATQLEGMHDATLASQIRGRRALYQAATPIALELARLELR
jgi:hypothetical protein